MTEISTTKMSSKGQIVIPRELRKGFSKGEKFVVIKSGGRLILKRIKEFDKNLEEDLEFARRTEAALKRYERGEFIEMEMDEFLKKLKRW